MDTSAVTLLHRHWFGIMAVCDFVAGNWNIDTIFHDAIALFDGNKK
jgi:hypothetical protein